MQFRIGQPVVVVEDYVTPHLIGARGVVIGRRDFIGREGYEVAVEGSRNTSDWYVIPGIAPIDDRPEAGSWDDEVWKHLGWSGPRRVSV